MDRFVKILKSLERWRECVQLQEMCLAQQCKVTGVLLSLFMHWQLCVYDNMMYEIAWKKEYHEILKKDRVEIPLETLWIMGLSHDVCC